MDTILSIIGIVNIILLVIAIILFSKGKEKSDLGEITALLKRSTDEQRDAAANQIASATTEQFKRFGMIQDGVQSTLSLNREEINRQLRDFQTQIDSRLEAIQKSSTETGEKISASVTKMLQESRAEAQSQIKELTEKLERSLANMQRSNADNNEKVTFTLESKLKSLQDSNNERLEKMQGIVDEKLQKTLETRLTQSFELVSKQLESVGQGLGEMKALAADTKSLKNALTNVKERGTYGEVRLEKLLSDILTPSQYDMQYAVKPNSQERVDFVIKLPGNGDEPLLLPIDSKFPIEDYNRLLNAEDKDGIEDAKKSLAARIRMFAKDIHDKYIIPPQTTDFALMFLPTEGLYAEVIQNTALFEELRIKYKVTPVGPSTLSACLGALQMGFKTLAIEKRSKEVWDTLSAVKKEFSLFGTVLTKARDKIRQADDDIEKLVGTRTRAINRALKTVVEQDTAGDLLLSDMAECDD